LSDPDFSPPGWQRFLDLLVAVPLLLAVLPVSIVIYLIGLYDTGSPLFRQKRVGSGQREFVMYKFRTMSVSARSVPTHQMDVSQITGFGHFLRRTKLDELPQLWNVVRGEMSLVGPRPCLISQYELIEARSRLGLGKARPGITGLAQVRGITMENPDYLARIDALMLDQLTPGKYFRLIIQTALPVRRAG
jgi:lipopolysaccharide/colanic/teichoic acid biosynthesis glycosyltransferase